MIDKSTVKQITQIAGKENVFEDKETKICYSYDATNIQVPAGPDRVPQDSPADFGNSKTRQRAPLSGNPPRRRDGIHRRNAAGGRRGGPGPDQDEQDPADRPGEPSGRRRTGGGHLRFAAGGGKDRPLLPARPGQPENLHPRGQRGRMRRRSPGGQIRRHQGLCPGAGSRSCPPARSSPPASRR